MTAEGERVVGCIAGGGALLLVDPTGQALAAAKMLGSSVGCGVSNQYSTDDPIGGLVSGFLGSQNSRDNSYSNNENPIGNLLSNFLGNN